MRVVACDNLRVDKALWVVCSLVVGAMQCNKKRLRHTSEIKHVKFGFYFLQNYSSAARCFRENGGRKA